MTGRNWGHVLKDRINLLAGINANDLKSPGEFALDNATNAPTADDYIIDVTKAVVPATFEAGQIVFSAVADNGDTITIFDGTNTTVFTFAAAGNGSVGAAVDVATGATATDSGNNLRTAINANTNINVTAGGATTTVSVTNAANAIGGSITKSDADNDYAITNFAGGNDGERIVQTAYLISDGSQSVRVWDGDGWSAWAAAGGGGGNPEATLPASEALAAGDFINVWNDAGTVRVRLADASTAVARRAHGFVLAAVLSGANAVVSFHGINTAVSGLTPGADQYLSTIGGGHTETAPAVSGDLVQILGHAISATEMYFNPNGLAFLRA